MVRTPDRKRRRIESSSASASGSPELVEVVNNRRRLDKGKGRARQIVLDEEEENDDGPVRNGTDEQSNDGHDATGSEELDGPLAGPSSQRGRSRDREDDQGSEMDSELEEKWRIWDLFVEDYHDVTEQLPLELRRNFQLMLEHDQQQRKVEQELQEDILRYLAIARSPTHRDALARAARSSRLAEAQSQPPGMATSNGDAANDKDASHLASTASHKFDGAHDAASARARALSTTSEDDVRTALVPSVRSSPTKHADNANLQQQAIGHSAEIAAQDLRQMLGEIALKLQTMVRKATDKTDLARTSAEWVYRHIQRLDTDLLKQEEALSLGLRAGTIPSTEATEAQALAKANMSLDALQDPSGTAGGAKANPDAAHFGMADENGHLPDAGTPRVNRPPKNKKGKKRKQASATQTVGARVVIPPTYVVDPHEPPYCYCNQVSYGEMVQCENPDCEREWFHFSCAGLLQAPKGKWYCRECRELAKPKARKGRIM